MGWVFWGFSGFQGFQCLTGSLLARGFKGLMAWGFERFCVRLLGRGFCVKMREKLLGLGFRASCLGGLILSECRG